MNLKKKMFLLVLRKPEIQKGLEERDSLPGDFSKELGKHSGVPH